MISFLFIDFFLHFVFLCTLFYAILSPVFHFLFFIPLYLSTSVSPHSMVVQWKKSAVSAGSACLPTQPVWRSHALLFVASFYIFFFQDVGLTLLPFFCRFSYSPKSISSSHIYFLSILLIPGAPLPKTLLEFSHGKKANQAL